MPVKRNEGSVVRKSPLMIYRRLTISGCQQTATPQTVPSLHAPDVKGWIEPDPFGLGGREIVEIEGILFTKICNVSPQLDSDGAIREFYPAGRYDNAQGLHLNDYGHGPFCEFRIPDHHPDVGSLHCPGVYAFVDQSKAILYVGRCTGESKGKGTLVDRFNTGYGHISPRSCFTPRGRSTNCRINNLVLSFCKEGHSIDLFFYRTSNGDSASQLEADLLNKIRTPWNMSIPNYSSSNSSPTQRPESKVRKQELEPRPPVKPRVERKEAVWREVIDNDFTPARRRGKSEVTVAARDVNRRLRWSQRYPSICSALSDRSGALSRRANVELIRSTYPNPSSTTEFIYRLL